MFYILSLRLYIAIVTYFLENMFLYATNKLHLQTFPKKGLLSMSNSKLTGIENLRETQRQEVRKRETETEKERFPYKIVFRIKSQVLCLPHQHRLLPLYSLIIVKEELLAVC